MKKDMGGVASHLSLASMLLEGEIPVRLRVILPIVENSLSASRLPARRRGLGNAGVTRRNGGIIQNDTGLQAINSKGGFIFN